jgi:opacity protein-like surface antigen
MRKSFLLCALFLQSSEVFPFTDVTSKYYVEAAIGTATMHSKARIWNNFYGPGTGSMIIFPNLRDGPVYDWNIGYGPANTVGGSPGFAGSASMGCDYRIPKSLFVCGAFFGGGATGAHCSIPYDGTVSTFDPPIGSLKSVIRSAIYLSDGGFFTVGGRFGASMGPIFAFFRLGWAPHRVKCKIQRMGTATTSKDPVPAFYSSSLQKKSISTWISTFLLGVGAEMNLTKNLILGFLIEKHIGGQKDYQFPTGIFTNGNGRGYNTLRVRAKPFLSQYLITMKYAIPACVLK